MTNATNSHRDAHLAYGEALVELIEAGSPVVTVEADLMRASGAALVHEAHRDRVIQVGIAEQNAVGVGAGLAHMGWIPFVDTFAVTLGRRAFDQVWQSVAFNDMNVKLNGMYSGFTAEANGATHQSLEDIAVMRTLPDIVIMEPADCTQLQQAVKAAVEHAGPVYLRNVRGKMPVICDATEPAFEIGRAAEIRPGNDATIVASGIMLQLALQAHEQLAAEGIQARVIDPRTIKPLDEETILRSAKETGAIVTVEDHGVNGGLGGAIAEFLAESCPTPLKRIGVREKFGNSGDFAYLTQAYAMDAPSIADAVRDVIDRKT